MSTAPRVTRGKRVRDSSDRDLALAIAVADLSASEPESPHSEAYRPTKRTKRTSIVRSESAIASRAAASQARSRSNLVTERLHADLRRLKIAGDKADRLNKANRLRINRLFADNEGLKMRLVISENLNNMHITAERARKVAQGKYSRSKQHVCDLNAKVQSLEHSLEQARTVAKAALALAAQRTAVAQPSQSPPPPPPRSALEVAQAIALRRAAAAAAAATAAQDQSVPSSSTGQERAVLA
jgi:hypothetical protein